MDWKDILPPWALAALALVSLALAVAFVIALWRNEWRISEFEISWLFGKVKAERAKKENKPAPRQARIIQRARAAGGAKAKIAQDAPKGAPATQEAEAEDADTDLEARQRVH
jgi:hypothetical protein